jgi:hypothetical protein
VFDSHCVPVYLGDRTDVAFRPFGLDVFDRLAQCCDEVRYRLDSQSARLASAPLTHVKGVLDGTRTKAMLDGPRPSDAVRRRGAAPPGAAPEEADVRAGDPKQRGREIGMKALRFDSIADHVKSLSAATSAVAFQSLQDAATKLKAARLALSTLRNATLTPDLLAGTGQERWRTMWEAAEAFSTRRRRVLPQEIQLDR